MKFFIPTPVQRLNDPFLEKHQVEVFLKREDLMHPHLGGNKWRKLKYNLEAFKTGGYHSILSFGGAYSNHIFALAAAGRIFDIPTIGIIRGEQVLPLNHTLSFALEQGMKLFYEDRVRYRMKDTEHYLRQIRERFGNAYILPEGGTNQLAVKGCAELVQEIEIDYDYLCCPCGSGGTLAGLALGAKGKQVLGFSVMKGNYQLNDIVKNLVDDAPAQWNIQHDYHFGGYAKSSEELKSFISRFIQTNATPVEPVYTAKMMYGIYDLIQKGFFKKGERVIALHTGGLQNQSAPVDQC